MILLWSWRLLYYTLIAAITVIFLYQCYHYKSNNNTGYIYARNAAIIQLVSFSIAIVTFPYPKLFMYNISMCISLIAFLFFHLTRLYYTFNTTAYALSQYQIIFFQVLFVVSSIVMAMVFAIEKNIFVVNSKTALNCLYAIVFIEITIIPCVTSFLFAKKLLAITVSLKQTIVLIDENNNNNNNNSKYGNTWNSIELSLRQESMISVITKHTLLVFCQACFFVVQSVYWSVHGIYGLNGIQLTIGTILYICFLAIFSIIRILWPLCIWLSFVFANKQYTLLCKICHNGCLKCFQNIAMYQLKKQNQQLMNEIATPDGQNLAMESSIEMDYHRLPSPDDQ